MLKMTTDTLESVEEPFRSLYEQKDGKFVLKVEGVEDTAGLKSALQKEREAAKEAKRYKELGLSPDEIAELKAFKDAAEEDKAKAAGEWDKLRAKLSDQHKAEVEKLSKELEAVRQSEHEAVVKTGLMSALAEAGATEEGMSLLPEILRTRARIDTSDGKRVVKILEADGTPMLGKAGSDATFADLAASAGERFPSLFKARVKSGGGTQPGSNGAGRATKTVTRSQFDGMAQSERAAFAREGGKVVDG